jgi:hypothetical protein
MVAIILAVYSILVASQGMYDQEVPLRVAQHDLQVAMDAMLEEVRESSRSFVFSSTFWDAGFGQNQTALFFPSARDDSGRFMAQDAKVRWQKLVMYVPFWDAQRGRGELRRFELKPVPQALFEPLKRFPDGTLRERFTVIILGNKIDIFRKEFDINGNEVGSIAVIGLQTTDPHTKVLDKLVQFDATIDSASGTAGLDITVEGNHTLQQETDMLSGAKGRN